MENLNHQALASVPSVQLESYSGPLDLLLQLIRKQEMDIFQIDIHKITGQYMDYLKKVPQPDLENAGDFIRMASLLLFIKSKSLLPKEEQKEEMEGFELQERLSHLLAEYERYQKAGELLYKKSLLGRDCWSSVHTFSFQKAAEEDKLEIPREKAIPKLIKAYSQNLQYQKAKKDYKIRKPIPSILQRLRQTRELWREGTRWKFQKLALFQKEKYSLLLSFLSILELSKAGFVRLSQKQLFSSIDIFVKKRLTESVIRQMSPEGEEEALEETHSQKSLF